MYVHTHMYAIFLVAQNIFSLSSWLLVLLSVVTAITTIATTTNHPPPAYQPPGASTHRHHHHQRNDSCRRFRGSGPLSVTAAEVADAHLPQLSHMQGLRLPICISSRGSLASTVTAGEVAEAQAPKLRQQLELQIRRGRNCQTTGGRIVRKHCKCRGTRRCCQEGLKTPNTWGATSSTSRTKMPAVRGRGSPTPLKPRPQRRRVCF